MAAKSSRAAKIERVSDSDVVITREFDAPAQLVFDALTKAEHLIQWWGPRYLTTEVEKLELRPGGTYRFIQRSPDGKVHPFKGEFREIVPPTRLVMTQVYEPYGDSEMVNVITLAERDGKTTLTSRSSLADKKALDGYLASGMEGGMQESYERLDELLDRLQQ